jgi:hypothetical protein
MATVQDIIDEVRPIIHDETVSYRWSDANLLDYVNAGIRQIVTLIPEANVTESVETISNNIARQTLPTGGIKFIKASRNYADNGTTPEGAIRYVEKDVLDTYDPDWEYDTTLKADGANFFENYAHDPREPKIYFLFPCQAAANKKVAIVYSMIPTALTVTTATYPLADEYLNAIIQYVIYRALTKESRDTIPDEYRQELWGNFLAALGLQRQASLSAGPSEDDNKPPDAN